MNPPDVSFILTCYNLQNYVEAAIRSLLAQKGGYSFEIIVIDDCSTDDSANRIAGIKDERIIFVQHEQNRGAAASINEAFALAQGRYIGRFDADDVWMPDFLEVTVPLLEKNPELGLVYGDIAIIDSGGIISDPHCRVPDYNDLETSSIIKALLTDYLICAPAILARREAWALALPLPDTLLYCDFEMALYIAAHWKFSHIPEILAQYRLHPLNMHATAIRQRRAEASIFDTLRRFQQHFPHLLSKADWKEIYQERYLRLGDQYFGANEMADARRCYWYGKAYLDKNKKGYLRRWLATYMPGGTYANLKQLWAERG